MSSSLLVAPPCAPSETTAIADPAPSSSKGRGGSKNLRTFLAGQAVFQSGTWLQLVAQTWLVLELSGSGTALGWLATATFGPIVVLGAWTGALADHFDRRRLLLVTHGVAAGQAAVLGVLVLSGTVSLAALYALALVHGLLYAVENPTRRAFVAEVVERDRVIRATSLASAVSAGAQVIGPALSGLVIMSAGVGWSFVANAVASAVGLVVLTRVRRVTPQATDRTGRWRGQAGAGLRYVWGQPELRTTMLLTAAITTFGFNHHVVIPVLARRTFGGGAGVYTLLASAMAAGAVVGALAGARRTSFDLRSLRRGALAFAVAMTAASLAPTVLIGVLAAAVCGATGLWFICGATSLLQLRVVDAMRGRVMALSAVVMLGAGPIGGPIIGWISESVGPRWGLAAGAAAALVASTPWNVTPMPAPEVAA